MARGKWIQSPDLPLPATDVDAHPKVGVFINVEWRETLLSLVQHADQPQAWESDDTDRIEQNAYRLYKAIRKARGLIGAIIPYAGEEAPPGTLPCDGSEYDPEQYPHLYEILGERYRRYEPFPIPHWVGLTPDLRGMFVLAAAPGTFEPFSTGGEAEHTLTEAEMPEHMHSADPHTHATDPHTHTNAPHQHGYTQPTFGIDVESVGVPDPTGVGNPPLPNITDLASVSIDQTTVTVQNADVTINPTGGGQAHNNMPPFIAMNYAIVCY